MTNTLSKNPTYPDSNLEGPGWNLGCIIGDWSFLPLFILAFLFRLLGASSWIGQATRKHEVCCPERQKHPITHWKHTETPEYLGIAHTSLNFKFLPLARKYETDEPPLLLRLFPHPSPPFQPQPSAEMSVESRKHEPSKAVDLLPFPPGLLGSFFYFRFSLFSCVMWCCCLGHADDPKLLRLGRLWLRRLLWSNFDSERGSEQIDKTLNDECFYCCLRVCQDLTTLCLLQPVVGPSGSLPCPWGDSKLCWQLSWLPRPPFLFRPFLSVSSSLGMEHSGTYHISPNTGIWWDAKIC